MSKLIEKLVLKRFNLHLDSIDFNSCDQFGYKKCHNTESMILGIVNDTLLCFENKCVLL